MRIKYLKLRGVAHLLSLECVHCSKRNLLLYFIYKNGEREDIYNWLQVSLLNTNYKIITKVLAAVGKKKKKNWKKYIKCKPFAARYDKIQ